MKKFLYVSLLAASMLVGAEDSNQFNMSKEDQAMYAEMLENNPAEVFIAEGGETFDKNLGGAKALATFLEVSEEKLPEYLAGFPRYIKKLDMVVGIDQVLQAMMAKNPIKPYPLKSKEMVQMSAYVKSLANDQKINIDIEADSNIKDAHKLGEKVYHEARGKRGLGCISCHSPQTIGMALRTQILPNLSDPNFNSGGTWPAYRMTKSSLTTLQGRFQGCMENSAMAKLPLGSAEMVALEVYVTNLSKGNPIAIPGLKR